MPPIFTARITDAGGAPVKKFAKFYFLQSKTHAELYVCLLGGVLFFALATVWLERRKKRVAALAATRFFLLFVLVYLTKFVKFSKLFHYCTRKNNFSQVFAMRFFLFLPFEKV